MLIDHFIFNRQTKTINISCTEYARLLHNDVQLMKYKETCNSKSNEIRKLHVQLSYYKRQAMKRNSEVPDEPEHADLQEVI